MISASTAVPHSDRPFRLAVADLIEALSVNIGAAAWGLFGEDVLGLIEQCWERDETGSSRLVPDVRLSYSSRRNPC